MRDSFASRSARLIKSPSSRQLARRRRALVVGGVLVFAAVSGVVGAISRSPAEALHRPQTGPFSYFPSE